MFFNIGRYRCENNSVEVKDGYYYIVPSDKALGSKNTEAGKIYTVKEKKAQNWQSGKFTVDEDGTQVYFSKGNLQYNIGTKEWCFAPQQYEIRHATGDNVGDNYASWETDNKWTDLFGWGMWLDGTAAASIIQTKTDGTYNPATTNNEFSNNTTTVEGTAWFTLSSAQWQYLFNTRGGTDAIRYAKATVCGKTGVILLPDGWSASTTLNNTNTADAAYNVNVFEKESDWKPLEDAGAVFLPAAGCRLGAKVLNVGSDGRYWSSSADGSSDAFYLYFTSGCVYPAYYINRGIGFSVRLVRGL